MAPKKARWIDWRKCKARAPFTSAGTVFGMLLSRSFDGGRVFLQFQIDCCVFLDEGRCHIKHSMKVKGHRLPGEFIAIRVNKRSGRVDVCSLRYIGFCIGT